MQPAFVCCGALGFAGVGLRVGPFRGQGAVEPFDLAVGLWPVGPGPFVLDVLAERRGENVGPVAGAVIGHHRGHGDPEVGEERVRSFPEPGRGLLAFVVEDLRVRHPRVVIDGVVQIPVTTRAWCSTAGGFVPRDTGLAVLCRSAAVDTPPAAVGDPTLLLDVHVHQLTGFGDLVPRRLRPAHRQPCRLVDVGQLRHPVPGQHPPDRGPGQVQVIRDPVRPPPSGEPQRHDPPLGLARQLVRRRQRSRTAVGQRQPSPVPVGPPLRRGR